MAESAAVGAGNWKRRAVDERVVVVEADRRRFDLCSPVANAYGTCRRKHGSVVGADGNGIVAHCPIVVTKGTGIATADLVAVPNGIATCDSCSNCVEDAEGVAAASPCRVAMADGVAVLAGGEVVVTHSGALLAGTHRLMIQCPVVEDAYGDGLVGARIVVRAYRETASAKGMVGITESISIGCSVDLAIRIGTEAARAVVAPVSIALVAFCICYVNVFVAAICRKIPDPTGC
ncbi:MAG: hypothetical protein NVV60_08390 [Luteimonas sp.]|nr:hypothetical protein [Luteimonas sp.]